MKKVVSVLAVLLLTLFSGELAFSGYADPERDLASSLRSSQLVIEKTQRKRSAGQPIQAEMTQLQQEADGLQASFLLLEERLRVRGQHARELAGKAGQRQEEMEGRYREILGQLQPLLDELAQGGTHATATLDSLETLFQEIVPAKKPPIFGSLPYSHLNSPALEPATTPLVVPAYRGGSSDVMAADTQGSADAPLTPEIAALAQSLDWNPVRIYEWVQENIATEWYWGAMKGAKETLHQKSGNDADQAALLIAMLRSAGFPARYVRGTIEFFPGIESAQRLTGLEDPLQIAAFLQKAGIPFAPIIAGGKITNFRIEHFWVETLVPYANYRGVVLDEQGKLWIPLDTHLKPSGYQWNDPEDFGSEFNLAALRDVYLLQPRTETPLEYLRSAFTQHLDGNLAAATFQEHLRTRTLVAEALGILPGSLQFHPTAITGEYTELPAELRHQLTFTAAGSDGSEFFTHTVDAASLSNRSVNLSYEPETVQDQQIIDSYGGLDNTPAYLVHLRPVLSVDGERKVVGRNGLPMGAAYTITIALISPNDRQEVVSHQVIGNLASLGIVSQQVVPPTALPPEDKDAARLLHEAALAYIDRWNAAEEELAAFLKVTIVRPLPTVVTTGGVIDVSYLFDVPHGFDWKGVFIDAGFRRIETVTAPGQEERAREFMRLSALEGSILENRIFEDNFGVASISTAKLLALAPSSLAPLLTLDATNVEALLPTLGLAENVTADIGNAVHQGYSVSLPVAEVAFKNWTGIGYIKEDPETGEAGYMLSGMIAGGMTAEAWAANYRQYVLQAPFGDPPNLDAQAAAHIVKITATDRQNGIVAKAVEAPLAVLVTDLKGRPVVGAAVTFTMLAGGGNFAASPTVVAQTGATGIARVSPALGVHTADNPSFQLVKQGDLFATQVGVNLFSAAVESRYGDLSLPQPFEIYGRPDLPTTLLKTFGDGNSAMVNTPAGTVKVKVVDQHGNPLSNIPVTFIAQAAVSQGSLPLPSTTRNIEFYRKEDCAIAFPLPGDCGTVSAFTQVSAHYGAGIETLLGNTLNTRYTVEATAPGLPAVAFSLYSSGYMDAGAYSAQIFIEQLVTVNEQGLAVNAAKAGDTLAAPLSAALFMLYNDFSLEKYSCTKNDAAGNPYQADCWRLTGSSLINTKRITDGTVLFTPTQGGGSVGPVEQAGDGLYQAPYTTGPQPALNQIEAIGEATVTVPEVYATGDYGSAVQDGYATTLPLRTVTVQTGQKLLFDRTSKELWPNPTPDKVTYQNYGVQVPTTISPAIVRLGDGGQARENVAVGYTIQPQGEAPAGYQALNAQVDLFDDSGTWVGYVVGDATGGTGTAVFSYGTVFNPAKKYYAQTVLNRGSAIEIRGDKVQVQTLAVDLDIDSDNNAGTAADGTHNAPSRNPLEEQVEDLIGHPGKVISPNLRDPDGDKISGFADGLRTAGVNLFDNQENSAGPPDSVPFVPLLIELAGSAFDPAQAKISFLYPGSDPAQVQKSVDAKGEVRFTPAPGSLRLWSKDGPQSRKTEDIAAGGDYITPGKSYTVAELGVVAVNNGWRLYLEGLTASNGSGDQRIVLQIDPDGDGPLPIIEGDAVRATAPLVGLIPDYNHNREIDDEDRHRAARGDTFYFWINEDDDYGETGADDIPGKGDADAVNNLVDGVRDLIDFFPVALDIKRLVGIFPLNVYSYRFKSTAENLKVVFPELTAATMKNYLVDVDTARRLGEVPTYQIAVSGVFPLTIGQAMMEHPQAKLDRLLSAAATQEVAPVILLEGVKPGTAPLVLEIVDAAGNQVFATSLKLSLDGVEQMFLHKNLIKELSEHSEYYLVGHNPVPSDKGMPDRIVKADFINSAHFSGFDAEKDGNDFIHVHGYNINDQDARGEQSEAFKRLYWSGSRARFWGISWYGWESKIGLIDASPNYHVNVRHAFYTGRLLKEFVNQNVMSNVTVFAHSLGNMVVSSAIEEGMTVAHYLMVNAAVAEEAYTPKEIYGGSTYEADSSWRTSTKASMFHPAWRYPDGEEMAFEQAYSPRLWASEWYKLFGTDDGRSILTWRNRFARVRDLTDTYVYYTPTDEAFRPFEYTLEMAANDTNGNGYQPNVDNWPGLEEILKNALSSSNTLGAYAWSSQELLKGRGGIPDSGTGGWGFNLQDGYQFFDVHVRPVVANSYPEAQLMKKPFFAKNSDNGFLYTDTEQPPSVSSPLREELLANEIPALTFAAGHRGVGKIRTERNIDIRKEYAVNKPWPVDRPRYEWRHSDVYRVAYPYLSELYKEWCDKIKGDSQP